MKKYEFIPYKNVGLLDFGMTRIKIKNLIGSPILSSIYGYPVEDRYLDDYNFFNILYSNKEKFEAIEIFPDMLDDDIFLNYKNNLILLSNTLEIILNEFKKVTDDFVQNDDESYSSRNLGIEICYSDEYVENVLIHDLHYYDEENKYLKENGFE